MYYQFSSQLGLFDLFLVAFQKFAQFELVERLREFRNPSKFPNKSVKVQVTKSLENQVLEKLKFLIYEN